MARLEHVATDEIGPTFARIVLSLSEEQGCPQYALSVCEVGLNPGALRVLANQGRDVDFTPSGIYESLEILADAIEADLEGVDPHEMLTRALEAAQEDS